MTPLAAAKLRALACVLLVATAGGGGAPPADDAAPAPAFVKLSVADLRAGYDVVWAVSDVHGRREELERLLVASGLALRTGPALAWNGASRRQLLLVAGDLVDGGPDGVGVVLLLARLQQEAARAGSAVVVLLGNHEAAFLADPRSATPELLASGAAHAAELGIEGRVKPRKLAASPLGAFLRRLPVAAFVGTWLVAHSGYVDARPDEQSVGAYLAGLQDAVERRDRQAFEALLDPRSIVTHYRWTRSRSALGKMRRRLQAMGLTGVLVGHDPDALGLRGTMAVNRDGWITKLDTGLKLDPSSPMLLRCETARIVRSEELVMLREGAPTCGTVTPQGPRPLPVAR